ncbi:CapA family protein [Bradyrhizobium sp. 143]|uniref:CapA family protein n=1 Tax=Bradyrhizobium sp. 143 TaxID=2782619 RepID=UPI001FF913FB|nr:CapA family protein [Bradyrhizobium sp. 143]MCK1715887.1 CapA family protein [Bradyrhizobium sp. 143]
MTELKSKTIEAAKPATSDNSFTVVAVGEMMVTRPFSMRKEPEFVGILDVMRKADLCYGHLEMNFGAADELKWTPRGAVNLCSYMIADPRIARDLAWAGVDCVSLAHNHSVDWGPEGIKSTIKHCEANDIAHAGMGENLEVARAPGYFETEKMRCAIVSLSSGNNPYEWAGLAKAEVPGRPGVNPLRVATRYEVDHASAEQLRAVGKKLGLLNDQTAACKEFNITPNGVGVEAASFAFVDGEKFGITSMGHAQDIAGNLRAIDEAYKMADFVIVAHHNRTCDGYRGENPSAFVVDFARKAIDAGADVYFGHGWHTFLGIEIYKGKPIIYGMGNFFMEEYLMHRVPADAYEAYGIEAEKLPTANPSAELHGGAEHEDWAWGAVYELKFVDGQFSEIRLYPCDLGMDFSSGKGVLKRTVGRGPHKYIDGIPHLATGANADNILRRLQHRCALRGTKMEIRDGAGVITV